MNEAKRFNSKEQERYRDPEAFSQSNHIYLLNNSTAQSAVTCNQNIFLVWENIFLRLIINWTLFKT